jgi:hypothetical protein
VGSKLPHGEFEHVTAQLTPRFLRSFETVAAIPALVLVPIDEGGRNPVVKVTEMGMVEEPDPQETIPEASQRTTARRKHARLAEANGVQFERG